MERHFSFNECAYVFLSLFFCRQESMGRLFDWHFWDGNAETKTQRRRALPLCIWMHHFASGSSWGTEFMAYTQNHGLFFAVACPTQPKFFKHLKIWHRNGEPFFPCSNIFFFNFYIQALYAYKSTCTDTWHSMLVCCLSAISLNVYICMKNFKVHIRRLADWFNLDSPWQ